MAAPVPFIMPTALTSTRGNPKLIFGEKVYYLCKERNGAGVDIEFGFNEEGDFYPIPVEQIVHLRCACGATKDKPLYCRGTATALLYDGVYTFGQIKKAHDNNLCEWNLIEIVKEYYKTELYDKLKTQEFPSLNKGYSWAVEQFERHYPDHTSDFPAKKKLKSTADKIRQKRYPMLPTKDQLEHLLIPEHLMTTKGSNPQSLLLLQHSFDQPGIAQDVEADEPGEEGGRAHLFVFGTAQFFKRLCEADCVFADGTFKTCPEPFYQLYILHILIGERMRPMLFCLCTRKTRRTYDELFTQIKALSLARGHPIQWTAFRTDFERAVMTSVQALIPGIQVRGCFFHFCSAVYKRVLSLELGTQYRNDVTRVKRTVKYCMALAFLPQVYVANTFQQIVTEYEHCRTTDVTNVMPDMSAFFEYMRKVWVQPNARFPVALWSVYTLDSHRTNNNVEGYHNYLLREFGVGNNLWKFLESLIDEEFEVRVEVAQLDAGISVVPSRRHSYVSLDQQLLNLKAAFTAANAAHPLLYAKQVSHLIKDF